MDRPEQNAIPNAQFTNHLRVGRRAGEFYLEFGQRSENVPHVHTLLVATPLFIKAMISTLTESVDAYEREYGPMTQPEGCDEE